MADTSELKRRVNQWAAQTQRAAADTSVNRLSRATPKVSGRLERARRRRDMSAGTAHSSVVVQPAGPGEPTDLPENLDKGRTYRIPSSGNARRPIPLRIGGMLIFRWNVPKWNRNRRSKGFFSKSLTASNWLADLKNAARGRPLP